MVLLLFPLRLLFFGNPPRLVVGALQRVSGPSSAGSRVCGDGETKKVLTMHAGRERWWKARLDKTGFLARDGAGESGESVVCVCGR